MHLAPKTTVRARHWAIPDLTRAAILALAMLLPTVAIAADTAPAGDAASSSAIAITETAELDTFDLSLYAGKVVYLDFWASWCGPCRATFPLMNAIREQYSDEQLVILAVNVDAKRSNAEKFLKKIPANFPIIYDPKGELASQYEIPGMPTSYLYDRQGELVHTHVGFRKNDAEVVRGNIADVINAEAEQ